MSLKTRNSNQRWELNEVRRSLVLFIWFINESAARFDAIAGMLTDRSDELTTTSLCSVRRTPDSTHLTPAPTPCFMPDSRKKTVVIKSFFFFHRAVVRISLFFVFSNSSTSLGSSKACTLLLCFFLYFASPTNDKTILQSCYSIL